MTIDQLKQVLISHGYKPSAGCWEDSDEIFVFSTKTHGPATHNKSKVVLAHDKRTGKTYLPNGWSI